jgi:hypothetical protein
MANPFRSEMNRTILLYYFLAKISPISPALSVTWSILDFGTKQYPLMLDLIGWQIPMLLKDPNGKK